MIILLPLPHGESSLFLSSFKCTLKNELNVEEFARLFKSSSLPIFLARHKYIHMPFPYILRTKRTSFTYPILSFPFLFPVLETLCLSFSKIC